MAALKAEMQIQMSAVGDFHLLVTRDKKIHRCQLDPVEVNQFKADGVDTTGVAFDRDFKCKPELPQSFVDQFNKDLEVLITAKSLKMYVVDHEPAIECTTVRRDEGQIKTVVARIKAHLEKDGN